MEWINAKEKLPHEEIVLIYIPTSIYQEVQCQTDLIGIGHYNPDMKRWFGERLSYLGTLNVTHWMPLPEKPREKIDV